MRTILVKYHKDLIAILLVLIVTVIPRFYSIGSTPPGIHGDEALTGIDAQKIIDNTGFRPVYVESALGQPAGPLYATAFLVRLFGNNIVTVRVSIALWGVLSILLFYLLLRTHFKITASLLATLFFSFSLIHLHYSRVGFMLISSICFALGTLIFLQLSNKYKDYRFALPAGVLLGLGIYSYNAYPVFMATILSILVVNLSLKRTREELKMVVVFLLSAFIVCLPFFNWVVHNFDTYIKHQQTYSIFTQSQTNSFYEEYKLFKDNVLDKSVEFFKGGKIDYVDGFGYSHGVDNIIIILAVLGLLISLKGKHYFNIFMFFTILVTVLFANAITFQGTYRRSIIAIIPIYFLTGYFFQWYSEVAFKTRTTLVKLVLLFPLVTVLIFLANKNIKAYFNDFADSSSSRWIYNQTLVTALNALDTSRLDKDIDLYIIQRRWFCNFEVIRFYGYDDNCKGTSLSDLPQTYNKPFVVILLDNVNYNASYVDRLYTVLGWQEIIDPVANENYGMLIYAK